SRPAADACRPLAELSDKAALRHAARQPERRLDGADGSGDRRDEPRRRAERVRLSRLAAPVSDELNEGMLRRMRKIIAGPGDWRGADLLASRDWIHEFTRDELAEIENALRAAKARGATLDTLTKEDFPLPTVSRRIAAARDFLEDGRGIYQFRGIKI